MALDIMSPRASVWDLGMVSPRVCIIVSNSRSIAVSETSLIARLPAHRKGNHRMTCAHPARSFSDSALNRVVYVYKVEGVFGGLAGRPEMPSPGGSLELLPEQLCSGMSRSLYQRRAASGVGRHPRCDPAFRGETPHCSGGRSRPRSASLRASIPGRAVEEFKIPARIRAVLASGRPWAITVPARSSSLMWRSQDQPRGKHSITPRES
jgi:hypothetical protein